MHQNNAFASFVRFCVFRFRFCSVFVVSLYESYWKLLVSNLAMFNFCLLHCWEASLTLIDIAGAFGIYIYTHTCLDNYTTWKSIRRLGCDEGTRVGHGVRNCWTNEPITVRCWSFAIWALADPRRFRTAGNVQGRTAEREATSVPACLAGTTAAGYPGRRSATCASPMAATCCNARSASLAGPGFLTWPSLLQREAIFMLLSYACSRLRDELWTHIRVVFGLNFETRRTILHFKHLLRPEKQIGT